MTFKMKYALLALPLALAVSACESPAEKQEEEAQVLEDLDNLVSENLTDFPEDMRPALTEDIESARDALEADDEAGMREAATQFQNKLSDAATGSEAQ